MPLVSASTLRAAEPTVRLFISDGSERSDYMPQSRAIELLGAPHSGVNLMASYYPRQSFWPERRLFGPDVRHYRHSVADQTETTRLADMNEWTDGYYSFELDNPDTEPLRQLADVRRHGQDARLTLTADIDTPREDLERMAELLRPFGRIQLRLNHEANGCTWFRFARNVGNLKGEQARRLYYDISLFFIRAHRVFQEIAPNVTFVACYNGMGEQASRGEIAPDDMPLLKPENLGLMYLLPGIVCSFDQYGSLHYGWPGHRIENPPLIGRVDPFEHKAFALTPRELCEGIISTYWRRICQMREEQVRVDLGELNFDEDIHGPDIQAHLVYESYDWIRQHPQVVGSVTFYELTDTGGLGLFRQREYGNLDELGTTVLLDVYRDIMHWPEFLPRYEATGTVPDGAPEVELVWRTAVDAQGLQLSWDGPARAVDFRENYWRRVLITDAHGRVSYLHTDARSVELSPEARSVGVFALPPDGRDNGPEGFRRTVPVPTLA